MVSFIDRQLINLLVAPIKADFQLTDTSVSLLLGVAFTIVHILLAIPMGRLVDRGHARLVILLCGVTWSLFSAAGGLSQTYTHLFISRMGVGAAEAGIYPACAALVAAYFTREKLARAMSIMLLGPFVGGGLSLIFGGVVIGELQEIGDIALPIVGLLRPWQMTLVLVSLFGMLPILLILTVRQPRRLAPLGGERSLASSIAALRRKRSFYLPFYPAAGLHTMAIYALPAWAPTLLMRRFATPISEVGVQLGLVSLVAGVTGMLLGPSMLRLLVRSGVQDPTMVGIRLMVAATGATALLIPLANSFNTTLILLFVIILCSTMPLPLSSAALQEATEDESRGFVAAIYFVSTGLIGLAISPTLVGIVTDHVFGDPLRVGTSIAMVLAGAALAASWLLARATPGYRLAVRATHG